MNVSIPVIHFCHITRTDFVFKAGLRHWQDLWIERKWNSFKILWGAKGGRVKYIDAWNHSKIIKKVWERPWKAPKIFWKSHYLQKKPCNLGFKNEPFFTILFPSLFGLRGFGVIRLRKEKREKDEVPEDKTDQGAKDWRKLCERWGGKVQNNLALCGKRASWPWPLTSWPQCSPTATPTTLTIIWPVGFASGKNGKIISFVHHGRFGGASHPPPLVPGPQRPAGLYNHHRQPVGPCVLPWGVGPLWRGAERSRSVNGTSVWASTFFVNFVQVSSNPLFFQVHPFAFSMFPSMYCNTVQYCAVALP